MFGGWLGPVWGCVAADGAEDARSRPRLLLLLLLLLAYGL